MKIALHISPTRTSYLAGTGNISARQSARCDEIVKTLSEAGAEAWVTEEPAPDLRSDVDLVLAADLEWHLSGGPLPARRTVLVQPDRDQVFELAERYEFPAVIFYVEFDAWTRARNNLIVRREIAEPLGGTLGPGAPFVMTSEHYAAWMDPDKLPLGARLVRFLSLLPPPPVLVSPEEARQRGFPSVTIRADRTTGLYPRAFPVEHLLLAMSGPPGGPLSLLIWDCMGLSSTDLESAVRERMMQTGPEIVEIVGSDTVYVMGADRTAVLFRTGEDRTLTSWIGFLLPLPAGTLLVMMGAGFGVGASQPTIETVLSHRLLRNTVATLQVA